MSEHRKQPRKGDVVVDCGHVGADTHWFFFKEPIAFKRDDGAVIRPQWRACCEACFVAEDATIRSYFVLERDVAWEQPS